MQRVPIKIYSVVIAILFASSAWSCPVCDSDTGQQVRAAIVDRDIGLNIVATLIPFAVVLGVTALIHFGGPRRKRERDDQP
jgi:hypothetical protein